MADLTQKPAPYTFVPVVISTTETQNRIFDAVFHDGSPGSQDYLTGELSCTLEALTPLLVGQKQYKADQIDKVGNQFEQQEFDPEKGILEPMLLAMGGKTEIENKRVIIPGSSVKGMLRHNLGAILGAPMERVGEQYFSYRPNLHISKGNNLKYQMYPAIILEGNPQEKTLQILLVEKDGLINRGQPTENDKVLTYAHGIDGAGKMAEIADKPIRNMSRKISISRKEKYRLLTIPQEIVQQYLDTNHQLADTRYGHLSRPPYANHPDKNTLANEIRNHNQRIFEKFRLIYVEVELQDEKPLRVVSFGHHFRYRWRYADTIRTVQVQQSGHNALRPQVSPLADEGLHSDSAKLSGARLLFGYAVDQSPESGTAGLGEGNFSRLAGRIAINSAVEYFKNDAPALRERFIQRSDADHQSDRPETFNIPLKILGTPKASAVEHYLVQDQVNRRGLSEHTVTYGDLPGILPSNSVLSGRKFYRHQPMVAHCHTLFELTENQEDKQATLARFISKPNSQFRFTLRFKDLRLWEIGAVLVALRPDILVEHQNLLTKEHRQLIDKAVKLRKPADKNPIFALKLGYGRPLGLGSVQIAIDRIRQLDNHSPLLTEQAKETWIIQALEAFLKQVNQLKLPLFDWLAVVLYAGRGEAAYPTAPDNKGNRKIFNYHTKIRREHAKIRRLQKNTQQVEPLDQPVKSGYPDFPFKPGK